MNRNTWALVSGLILVLGSTAHALSPDAHSVAPTGAAAANPAPIKIEALGAGWEAHRDAATGQILSISGGRTARLGETPEAAARAFLAQLGQNVMRKSQVDQLVPVETRRSLAGWHVTFQQRVGGLAVVDGWVRVHLTPDLSAVMATSRVAPAPALLRSAPTASLTAAEAQARAAAAVRATSLRAPAHATLMAKIDAGEVNPVFKVELPAQHPAADFEVLVDGRTGQVLSTRDVMVHFDATAKVFDPNPCVTLKDFTFKDDNNSATAIPEAGYKSVTLQGLDGSGTLKGQFADVSGTTGGAANEATGAFNYNRSDQRFEQAMVYYHIDRAQRYIQSLGFNNVQNRQQVANAHGTTDDNSWYSPMTKELTFGDGGVHDAQDADVICHEYGHSIQDNQVPGWGGSEEAGAMGEGFGDYWAGSIRSDQSFNPLALAIWDATAYSNATPPALRRLDSTKHYPEAIQHEVHADGEIWSACLRQIWDQMGNTATDKLVLQAHFFLHPGATFADGANALLQADTALFRGSHADLIRKVFTDRGILTAQTHQAD